MSFMSSVNQEKLYPVRAKSDKEEIRELKRQLRKLEERLEKLENANA